MVREKMPVDESAWALVSGLPHDVDAWIAEAWFGEREEYTQAIEGDQGAPLLFQVRLANQDGEPAGQQGYSVGSGWEVSDDGKTITHPVRQNIVRTSMYGKFIQKVTKVLGVPMHEYGSPLDARTWEGLGFHWMLEPHKTVTGAERESPMPSSFLGDTLPYEGGATGETAGGLEIRDDLRAKLTQLAKANDFKAFRKLVLQVPEVTDNDDLMALVLDAGDEGFWAAANTA